MSDEARESRLPSPKAVVAGAVVGAAAIQCAPLIWPDEAEFFEELMAPLGAFDFRWVLLSVPLLCVAAVCALVCYEPEKPEQLVLSFIWERAFRFVWLGSLALLSLQSLTAYMLFVAGGGNTIEKGVAAFRFGLAFIVVFLLLRPVLSDLRKASSLFVRIWRIFSSRWEIEDRFSIPAEGDGRPVNQWEGLPP